MFLMSQRPSAIGRRRPDEHRQTIERALLEAKPGTPYRQLATICGWPVATTRYRILRYRLEEELPEEALLELVIDFHHFICKCGADCVVGPISLKGPSLCSVCRASKIIEHAARAAA